MSISEQDNYQDKTLTEHTIRIDMLERNMATIGQAVAEITRTTAELTVQVAGLVTATKNNLESVKEQTTHVTTLLTDVAWVKRIGYAAITLLVGIAAWYLQKALA